MNFSKKNPNFDHVAAFWNKVEKTDTCWIWTGAIGKHGYGNVRINNKYYRAHRVSFELSGRIIPKGFIVMHSCDNRSCVRPSHLEAGTQSQNITDAYERNRKVAWFILHPENYKRDEKGRFIIP